MGCGEIRDNGWKQGSLFDQKGKQLVSDALGIAISDGDYLVAISHSCDIVNPSYTNVPYVELVQCSVCAKDGNNLFGKNSRILHLPVSGEAGTTFIEVNFDNMHRIDRCILEAVKPSAKDSLSDEVILTLRNWLANRYRRGALPDEFNERRRSAWGKVRRKAKTGGDHLIAVYLVINPRTIELPEDKDYRIRLYAVISDKDYSDEGKRSKSQECIDSIATALSGCRGIDVEDWRLVPEIEVSHAELRLYFQRLDFDDLSLREGDDPPSQ